jgi:hypothetical protein
MKKLLPFSIAVFCFYLNSYSQYCTPSNGSGCSAGDYINNFTLHTLEKLNSGCNGDAGGFSHDTSTTTTLELGKNYNISVQSGSQYGQGFGVWIDFNGDGDFGDTLEFVYASPNYGTNVFSGTISVPDSFAVTGQTRVRVRCNYNALVYANDTCNSFSYGETEDYTITITQPPLCNEPPVVGTLESNKYVTCFYNDQITLSLSGGTDGWGQYYIGQFSTDGINWTSSPEYAKFPSEVNTSGSNYYRTYAVCGSSSDTSNVIYVEHKPIDSLTFSHTDVSCYGGADGSVSVTVFGGTPPYNYSWNYGQTAASLPNTPTLNGMNAGNYDVTVTDASGCTASGNESINEPNELQVYPYSNNANCGVSDGMAWVQVYDGTAPYTYNWSNSATTDSIFNLAAGTYFVTVTDNKGCIKSTSITVSENGAPYVSVNVTNVSCFGLSNGSAQATATSGTPPYTYLWDAAAGNQTDSTATGLAAGTYFITVTDNAGCKTIKNVVITQPSNLTVSISITHVNCFGQNSGSAYTSVSGGNYPYTYIWSNSDSTDNITSVPTGTYVVTVTDNNNCTVTDSAFINQPSQIIPSLTTALLLLCSTIGKRRQYIYK